MAGKTQTLESIWDREPLVCGSEIPTGALRHKLGWTHVSTPDSDVEHMVREACDRAPVDYTPAQIDETVRAALWLHEENRAEYRAVMSGRL